ncbi:hypothetical protein QE152_g29836 [Popillia japonica]|uniref:Uncharacterized protein n=1 Tax=Popillia japonica TaxID=7064 RepID=A0AAW1JGA2_POPJA
MAKEDCPDRSDNYKIVAENSLKFNLGDLERLAPEEVFNLLDGITEEQALNSDVEGDSDAEDNLAYDTPVASANLRFD